jgi:uncharacterized membrane-anchored protein
MSANDLRTRLRLGIWVTVCLIQLTVPAALVIGHERTLAEGTSYKFRTRPVDPYDAFRGRYVALAFEQDTAHVPQGVEVKRGRRVYVSVEGESQGFARLGDVHLEPPDGAFLRARVVAPGPPGRVRLALPFDRYYLEEGAAPEADRLYRLHTRRQARDAWVVVRIRDGHAAVEELYVGGEPIEEVVGRLAGPQQGG